MKKRWKRFFALLCCVCLITAWATGCADTLQDGSSSSLNQEQSSSEQENSSENDNSNDNENDNENEDLNGGNGSLPEEEMKTVSIVSPLKGEVVYPYTQNIKGYLNAEYPATVNNYYNGQNNQGAKIVLRWSIQNVEEQDVDYVILQYATQADYSDAITYEHQGAIVRYELCNLYKATQYYWRVRVMLTNGKMLSAESNFETTDLGPRVMMIDGIYNVRDVGGYATASGKTTLQGLIYRGGALSPSTDPAFTTIQLSENGARYMRQTLGIKTDLDFRASGESFGITESPITGAKLVHRPISAWSFFNEGSKESIRQVFSFLANQENYPIYYHCTGGADRTGSITYLLNALLGVSEEELIEDYEFTSFSIYGVRNAWSGVYSEASVPCREELKRLTGATLAEKAEAYLLSIGVTQTEINNIRAIMFGEELEATVSAPAVFRPCDYEQSDFVISVVNAGVNNAVVAVSLGGTDLAFTTNGKQIIIAANAFPATLQNGRYTCKVSFTNGKEESFELTVDTTEIVAIDDYMEIPADGLKVSDENLVSSRTAVGYDKFVKVSLQTMQGSKEHGSLYAFIGSYGVALSGGAWRFYTRTSMDSVGLETSNDKRINGNQTAFNSPTAAYFKVNLIDETTVEWIIIVETGGVQTTYKQTIDRLSSGEIASENACMSFGINTSRAEALVVYGVKNNG